jgi:hypothetical protein
MADEAEFEGERVFVPAPCDIHEGEDEAPTALAEYEDTVTLDDNELKEINDAFAEVSDEKNNNF